MYVTDEVTRIKERIGRFPNNLELFSQESQNLINSIKISFFEKYGYTPTLKESIYVIENLLTSPETCKNDECMNFAKFTREKYNYCSRLCSDSCSKRNSGIQTKRLPKIDYSDVHKKVVETKNIIGSDGLTTHDRIGKKVSDWHKGESESKILWNENTKKERQSRSNETYAKSYEKRIKTNFDRYGTANPNCGGYSKLKHGILDGFSFIFQGYEDVAIYDICVLHGEKIENLIPCSRFLQHSFSYIDADNKTRKYYPDFYNKRTNTYIEVKSVYWCSRDLSIDLKKDSVLKSGFNYERLVYDKNTVREIRKELRKRNFYID
jgi:hypothetical protein